MELFCLGGIPSGLSNNAPIQNLVLQEIVVHTNDPRSRCIFCNGGMFQNLYSLMQLFPICYKCKISTALFLHVGLPLANNLHMLSCHTVLYCSFSSDRA